MPVASRIVKDLDGDSDETPSQSAGVLLVTIWELGEAAGPLLIAPLSEALGRAPLLHGTNALFIVATLLAALSRSTGALVAARALTGAAVSSNVLYPPIVGDVFPPEQRGRALSVFMFATLLGGTLGPAFGGAAAEGMPMLGGWRAVLWASLALATLCEGLALVFFRETYAVAILRRRAAARRLGGRDKALLPGPSSVGETSLGTKEEGSAAGFHVSSITRPFAVLFGSGVLASLAVFGSVIFSYFYVVSVTLPTILDEIYGLSPAAIGSSFLANGESIFRPNLQSSGLSSPTLHCRHRISHRHRHLQPISRQDLREAQDEERRGRAPRVPPPARHSRGVHPPAGHRAVRLVRRVQAASLASVRIRGVDPHGPHAGLSAPHGVRRGRVRHLLGVGHDGRHRGAVPGGCVPARGDGSGHPGSGVWVVVRDAQCAMSCPGLHPGGDNAVRVEV